MTSPFLDEQVLHCGQQLPITVTLANIISRSFADEYEERRAEEAAEAAALEEEKRQKQSGGSSVGPDGTLSLPLFGE